MKQGVTAIVHVVRSICQDGHGDVPTKGARVVPEQEDEGPGVTSIDEAPDGVPIDSETFTACDFVAQVANSRPVKASEDSVMKCVNPNESASAH